MNTLVKQFLQEEQGQDLVEYSLLLAFVALVGVSILTSVQSSIKGIWTTVNTTLATANTQAAAGAK